MKTIVLIFALITSGAAFGTDIGVDCRMDILKRGLTNDLMLNLSETYEDSEEYSFNGKILEPSAKLSHKNIGVVFGGVRVNIERDLGMNLTGDEERNLSVQITLGEYSASSSGLKLPFNLNLSTKNRTIYLDCRDAKKQ